MQKSGCPRLHPHKGLTKQKPQGKLALGLGFSSILFCRFLVKIFLWPLNSLAEKRLGRSANGAHCAKPAECTSGGVVFPPNLARGHRPSAPPPSWDQPRPQSSPGGG
jgi:hypothetical protein